MFALRRGTVEQEKAVAFDNPETEKRWQAARKGVGVGGVLDVQRIADGLEAFKASANGITVSPNEKKYADLRSSFAAGSGADRSQGKIIRILKRPH